jgi:5-methylcytosine-specific restriction endonuclease McrA
MTYAHNTDIKTDTTYRCVYCGRIHKRNLEIFCSDECSDKFNGLEESYKNRVLNGTKRKRRWGGRSTKDKLWSKTVRALAEWKCQECGEKGTCAHHIIPLDMGGDRLSLDNGVCLCASCHRKKHPELPDKLFF